MKIFPSQGPTEVKCLNMVCYPLVCPTIPTMNHYGCLAQLSLPKPVGTPCIYLIVWIFTPKIKLSNLHLNFCAKIVHTKDNFVEILITKLKLFFQLLGSGGAIVGLLLDNKKFEIMRNELQQSIGCIVVDIIPNLWRRP